MNALPEGTHGEISVFEPVLYDERRSVTRTLDTEVGPELLGFMRGSQTRTLHGGVDGLNRQTDASEGELARLLQNPAAIRLVTLSRTNRYEWGQGTRRDRRRCEVGGSSLEARQTADSWWLQDTYGGGFE